MQWILSPAWAGLSGQFLAQNKLGPSNVIKLFGRSPSPATASLTDIWPAATAAVRILPSAGFTLAVSSDSVNDVNATGSGAWQVTIPYLDTNYIAHVAVFALNGQTKVATPIMLDGVAYTTAISNVLRVNPPYISAGQVAALAAGTALPLGNVYVFDNVSGVTAGVPSTLASIYGWIGIGDGIAQQALYTVPKGQQLLIMHVYDQMSAAGTSALYGKLAMGIAQWSGGSPPTGALLPFQRFVLGAPAITAGSPEYSPAFPDVLTEGSELRFQGQAGAASAEISIVVEGLQYAVGAQAVGGGP